MKYVVIEHRNPELDGCESHPSGMVTMLDGDDPWPVTSICVSVPYDTERRAYEKLEKLYRKRASMMKKELCDPWIIGYDFDHVLSVLKPDEDGQIEDGTYEWVFKYEVVGIPESVSEVKLI